MPALRNEREFDALAHGINAVGADAHAITEVPFERLRFCAAPAPRALCSMAPVAPTQGDDGVVALAVDATGASGFLERADRQQSFHKDLEKLDEAPKLLHGDDQAFVLLAEVVFHELRGLPIHEFALGAVGASLGFRGFRSDLLETTVGIQRGF